MLVALPASPYPFLVCLRLYSRVALTIEGLSAVTDGCKKEVQGESKAKAAVDRNLQHQTIIHRHRCPPCTFIPSVLLSFRR